MNMKTRLFLTSILMLATIGMAAQEEGQEPVKKYGFKSAIAKISTTVMGQKIGSTAYIEDYGAKECQKTKISVPGAGEVEAATIVKDGKSWSVNYTTKQIQETTVKPEDQPNFLAMDDKMVEKFKVKEVGKEKVLDKDCTVYTLETETQGMKANMKVWIYKGLAMKSEASISGMTITAEVVEFEEDAMVLPQLFDIPKF